MNDHDLDIILALAEDRLSGRDAVAAEAHIASDPELAAELEAQRTAIAAIHAAGQVEMTDAEREHLHAALIEQLHLEPAAAAAAPPRESRWAAWLAPLAGAAAVAAVLVGALVLLPTMIGSDDSTDVTAVAAAQTTTTAEAQDAAADAAAPLGTISGGEAEDDGAALESAAPTTVAASSVTSSGLILARDVPRLVAPDVNDLEKVLEDQSFPSTYTTGETVDVDETLLAECIARLDALTATSDHELLGVAQADDGTELTYISYLAEATDKTHVASLDLETCELVATSS